MKLVSRTLQIDSGTHLRLREMAAERGQEVAAVLAEAVALLDSVVDLTGPDIGEDRLRLDEFNRTWLAVPLNDVKAWVDSWGTSDELPRPHPRKIGVIFLSPAAVLDIERLRIFLDQTANEIKRWIKVRHARPCAGYPHLERCIIKDVDGRDEPGHDEKRSSLSCSKRYLGCHAHLAWT